LLVGDVIGLKKQTDVAPDVPMVEFVDFSHDGPLVDNSSVDPQMVELDVGVLKIMYFLVYFGLVVLVWVESVSLQSDVFVEILGAHYVFVDLTFVRWLWRTLSSIPYYLAFLVEVLAFVYVKQSLQSVWFGRPGL